MLQVTKIQIPQSPTVCTGKEKTWKAWEVSEYVQHKVWHILHQTNERRKREQVNISVRKIHLSQDTFKSNLSPHQQIREESNKYQIRCRYFSRLQRITFDVICTHDDATRCCTAHNEAQTNLVHEHSPATKIITRFALTATTLSKSIHSSSE